MAVTDIDQLFAGDAWLQQQPEYQKVAKGKGVSARKNRYVHDPTKDGLYKDMRRHKMDKLAAKEVAPLEIHIPLSDRDLLNRVSFAVYQHSYQVSQNAKSSGAKGQYSIIGSGKIKREC